ncbi:YdcF family protein [Peristeroidobacter soli]|jgi:uncharacterized SAM-binding protein YcdF (DUF218 family)|uniref:YdcF family protein n=1 Tax=Peristeroidobacter soli TaxID=2497877 RepID=UPI00101B6B98|nr:ElyC/SanA/YdcF family protein [Peristeroidobacter soli]
MAAIIGAMLVPSGLAYLLFALGLVTAFKEQWRKLSWALLAVSGAITTVFSTGSVATLLLSPLEYEYPAVHDTRTHRDIKHIVVLTGYAADDPAMPLTGRMHWASAYRVMMALQLQRGGCGNCDVIVSGSPITARIMGESLVALGLPKERLILEADSATTADSAEHLAPMLKEPFFLVTSAGHLRRSLAVLHKQGLQPIPVPTDYQGPRDWRNAEERPSPQSLVTSDLAMHEYIGLMWYRLKGAI